MLRLWCSVLAAYTHAWTPSPRILCSYVRVGSKQRGVNTSPGEPDGRRAQDPCFGVKILSSGPMTGSISITWRLNKNMDSWASPRLTESETLGLGPVHLRCPSPPGESDTFCWKFFPEKDEGICQQSYPKTLMRAPHRKMSCCNCSVGWPTTWVVGVLLELALQPPVKASHQWKES